MSNGTKWGDCISHANQMGRHPLTTDVDTTFRRALAMYLRSLGVDNDTVESVMGCATDAEAATHTRAFAEGWNAGFDQGRKS